MGLSIFVEKRLKVKFLDILIKSFTKVVKSPYPAEGLSDLIKTPGLE